MILILTRGQCSIIYLFWKVFILLLHYYFECIFIALKETSLNTLSKKYWNQTCESFSYLQNEPGC